MKKHALLIALGLAVLSPSTLASSLVVRSGETYTVQRAETVVVDELVLEDNARIRFAPGVHSWSLEAARARIGNGVDIDGSGVPGSNGASGQSAAGVAADCSAGASGAAGAAGSAGGNGVDLRLRLGLAQLGSMAIRTDGGRGGDGGSGGNGQDAGEVVGQCTPPAGGRGGQGGAAGNGGSGGNIVFYYWDAASGLDLRATRDRIQTSANEGEAGAAGVAGKGGKGAKGHYIRTASLSGNRKWVAGGKDGATGAEGAPGRTGSRGSVMVQEDVAGKVDQLLQHQKKAGGASAVPSAAQDDTIDALRQQLEAMQKRLDALEKSR